MITSQGRSGSSLVSRNADCKSTTGDDEVLKTGYAWVKAFEWMVKPAVTEFTKGNKSEKAAVLTAKPQY